MAFVVEVDEQSQLSVLGSILEPFIPLDYVMLNTKNDLFNYEWQWIKPENVFFVSKTFSFELQMNDESFNTSSFSLLLQESYI